ncbi:flippase-like domain-containing protein [Chitinophaga polysaccharea]|uniref:lysylphosphatidylglycerol synthase transmembrane domain-containing protein n=1 Tax=Chitinophaga TaxID=79328 RepID=UPI001455230B|nr:MULTISPECIES: lysylphosphatidylglycerol synthase transmembrane domain-containing protein [Chitinophaga]NLR62435.1 flippase-like domain-containing protein [Chitinophaga polysaccharea]NLU92396.1 flippase-like domain-containing protein [Chitinophaga sp. Ak27]
MPANNIHTSTAKPGRKVRLSYWVWTVIFIVFAVILITHYLPEIKKEVLLLEKVKVYWLVIAVCFQLLTYLFAALVYGILLRAYKLQHQPSLWELIKAAVIALFFNQTVPSGGISGNAYIFRFLQKNNLSAANSVTLIVTEMVCYYAAIEVLIIPLLLFCLLFYKSPHVIKIVLFAGIVIFLFLSALILLAGKQKILVRIYKKIKKIKFIGKKLSLDFSQGRQSQTQFLKKEPRKVVNAVIFQLLVLAVDSLTVCSLFWGMGVQISPLVIFLAFMCTRILSILPISPGSLVVYESGMVYFLVSLGAPVGTSIVVTLLYRLLSFWLPMPVGLILYRREMHKSNLNQNN